MSFIQNINSFFLSIKQPFIVISNINRQKKFIHENINHQLSEAKRATDGSLNENDFKKITGYYGLAVPAILGEAFCTLRGIEMTNKERLAGTSQGAMTGLFDDFFDEERLSEKEIEDMIKNPGRFKANTVNENLFLHFYKTALNNTLQPVLMQDHLFKVYTAQLLSKEQVLPGLNMERLKEITIRKGAESVLFYRSVFDNPISNAEEKMLFTLGGLMQLCNDIFDVYKDHKQGIKTLVTSARKINDLRSYFTSILESGIEEAKQVDSPLKNIRKFLGIISLGIFSRCFVCLDQLEKVEMKYGGEFDPDLYERKDLICDMDTAANKWRSLKYHVRIWRKFY
jgi:hypothetical protein